ncbi:tyrosine-type recombinase/integrase [Terriglobus aquaticus]|uniref:Tyrosine-type recombinase/integrase n=1 Tax=Terriglobus aquaticus TaxID=940139 RepID=A0ABW9KGS4_9BACT|nr:integrase arm-type DNA-binding domain-containing protein [Terriglobus aquaticus]
MPLTDATIRQLKPAEKPRKVSDGKGLYVEVMPTGGKLWRLKYRIHGKEKRISLGTFPETGLKVARESRDEARALIAKGIDPSAHRKATKRTAKERAANDFEAIAREWFAMTGAVWADTHRDRVLRRLERDVFPALGPRPISEITPPEILQVLRRIEKRTVETAHRAMRSCGQIFRYGIATGRCTTDPTRDLRGALSTDKGGSHFAATTEPKRLGQILTMLDAYPGTPVVRAALQLAPLVFVRPGELRKAEWSQFDLDEATWQFTSSKTKQPHIVPLATQAVAILRELHKHTGGGRLVFPGARSSGRPMSDNALLVAMRSMEIGQDELTTHGFRAVARTILDETLGFRPDVIEHQLAHKVKDPLGRAYNRTQHLPERRRMMQEWADYLNTLRGKAGTSAR